MFSLWDISIILHEPYQDLQICYQSAQVTWQLLHLIYLQHRWRTIKHCVNHWHKKKNAIWRGMGDSIHFSFVPFKQILRDLMKMTPCHILFLQYWGNHWDLKVLPHFLRDLLQYWENTKWLSATLFCAILWESQDLKEKRIHIHKINTGAYWMSLMIFHQIFTLSDIVLLISSKNLTRNTLYLYPLSFYPNTFK